MHHSPHLELLPTTGLCGPPGPGVGGRTCAGSTVAATAAAAAVAAAGVDASAAAGDPWSAAAAPVTTAAAASSGGTAGDRAALLLPPLPRPPVRVCREGSVGSGGVRDVSAHTPVAFVKAGRCLDQNKNAEMKMTVITMELWGQIQSQTDLLSRSLVPRGIGVRGDREGFFRDGGTPEAAGRPLGAVDSLGRRLERMESRTGDKPPPPQ